MIDKYSALSLVFFFVIQAMIYVFCRMKLAEIRRETLPSKLKLRLLRTRSISSTPGSISGLWGRSFRSF